MRSTVLFAAILCLLFASCKKTIESLVDKGLASNTPGNQFIQYTISKGQQYCDKNGYKPVEVSEMKFVARFDSSAIYTSQLAENQYDINKLYGFSDNNADHHQYSARFGWRWSDNALRLFAYVYNNGQVTSKELGTISIGANVNCSIQVADSNYVFLLNGVATPMPRTSTTAKAEGYQLYPYFGGNEAAPHDIHIWIKNL